MFKGSHFSNFGFNFNRNNNFFTAFRSEIERKDIPQAKAPAKVEEDPAIVEATFNAPTTAIGK